MKARGLLTTAVLVLLLVGPLTPVPHDVLSTAILACSYLIAALSLVLLIGLVGQISLCQAALIGMGAFVSALATKHAGVVFPFTLVVGTAAGAATATVLGTVALRVRGLYLAVATMIFAYVCDQYLFAQPWLVESQTGTSIPFQAIGKPNTLPFFDLGDAKVFYFVSLAVATLSLYLVANLRDSRLGRAFAAVRGSEVAAASLGINVVRTKLLGFACSGALAGLGGALLLIGNRTVAPEQFNFTNSLDYLAIAAVGGLRSLGGAIASALLFALLVGELFFRVPSASNYLDLISGTLLIAVLLFFRGGLGAVPERLGALTARLTDRVRGTVRTRGRQHAGERRWVPAVISGLALGRLARQSAGSVWRLGGSLVYRGSAHASDTVIAAPAHLDAAPIDVVGLAERLAGGPTDPVVQLHVASNGSGVVEGGGAAARNLADLLGAAVELGTVAGQPQADGRREPILLRAEEITVRFGGLTAVSNAGLQVGAGEIVGLIGPNGAGKTTLFNSILGLNQPVAGHVELFGHDVTSWEVHRRAALGVGRTFQILQLFGELTVFDNLLVATHLHNRTGLWGSLVVSPGARRAESAARRRVRAVLRLMDLENYADRKVAGLPFGVLRLIEVARTLVTGARLVCFDEPASGLDSAETERLLEWFRFLRDVGITLLVIEHDVSFVVRLCDWIYVLDQGRLLASGPPAQIQRDPAVIASYLGAPLEVAS